MAKKKFEMIVTVIDAFHGNKVVGQFKMKKQYGSASDATLKRMANGVEMRTVACAIPTALCIVRFELVDTTTGEVVNSRDEKTGGFMCFSFGDLLEYDVIAAPTE